MVDLYSINKQVPVVQFRTNERRKFSFAVNSTRFEPTPKAVLFNASFGFASFIDTIKEMRYRLCIYNRVCIAEKESK